MLFPFPCTERQEAVGEGDWGLQGCGVAFLECDKAGCDFQGRAVQDGIEGHIQSLGRETRRDIHDPTAHNSPVPDA